MNLKTILVVGLATLMGCYLPPETQTHPEVRVVYVYESSWQSRYEYGYNAYWQHVSPLYRPLRFTFEGAMDRAIQERHRRPEPPRVEPRKEHPRPERPRPSEAPKKPDE